MKDNIKDTQPVDINSMLADKNLETSLEKDQNKTMVRSHLRRRLEKQSKKTLFLTGFGLLILTILIVLYGQALLVNFTVLLSKTKTVSAPDIESEKQKVLFIAPPILDQLPDATNSATIQVSGIASSDEKIQIRLYVNDELADVTDTGPDDTFNFTDVEIKEGNNKLKTVAVVDGESSKDSNEIVINYLKNAPSLSIDYPQDGITFSGENNTLVIKGKTDSGNSVKVNDYIAITKNDGSFTYNLKLQNGENHIKAVATDQAGNKTEKEIRVNYSP